MAKILVVDDQRDIRFVMSELLDTLGHEVIEASSAPGALKMLEFERPDLVLLDLNMPGMNGAEALARIRRQEATRHTRVLILTGSTVTGDIDRARELGIAGVIPKPWQPDDVVSLVEAAIANSVDEN